MGKPSGYWNDFSNLKHELLAFIEEYGLSGKMPTHEQLLKAKQSSISWAITKHGGPQLVAERIGLELTYTRKNLGYWDEFENLRDELLTFIDEHGTSGIMPMYEELQKAGRGDLKNAIGKHGGISVVAEQLGLKLSYLVKPQGYWEEFNNFKSELFLFINEYGTSGTMPSSEELKKANRGDLAYAIQEHGGHSVVAEKLSLTYARKKQGYWESFSNLSLELLNFIKENGSLDVMPTSDELKKSGRGNLATAIQKHGGYSTVAKRLGLKTAYVKKGYWQDFSNVKYEILKFIEERNISDIMPSQEELKKAGRGDLAQAIQKHGGYRAVAEKLDLALVCSAKPKGYWDDFNNLKLELIAFIDKSSNPCKMPTDSELKKHNRGDLINAIKKHGGYQSVAKLLGLSYRRNKSGHWHDLANLEREIFDFIEKHGIPQMMPTYEQLQEAKRGDIISGIYKHGGFPSVAQKLGLELSYTRKIPGYWDDFSVLKKELFNFIDHDGSPGTMPTQKKLQKSGRSDIVTAIQKHGGYLYVSEQLGLKMSSKKWTLEAIRKFVASLVRHLKTFTPAELYLLFQQNRLLHSTGVSKGFVKALATGRFPIEEVEKFVNGEPSIVDRFLQDRDLTLEALETNNNNHNPETQKPTTEDQIDQTIDPSDAQDDLNLPIVQTKEVLKSLDHHIVSTADAEVVEGWKNAILDIFPESQIATKTFTPNWQNRSPLAPLNKGGTPTTPPVSNFIPSHQPNQEKTLTTPPLVRGAGGDLPRYLILNYEKFQQPESPDWVRTLINSEQIDFIVIDEIHYTKQRQVEDMSRRKELIGALITSANQQNPNLHVIGMSATPVINNLQEGKSLVEMVTGVAHNELDIRPTIPNCMKLHQRLVTLGIRWMPEYNLEYEQIEIPVDCGDYIDQIRALGKNGTPLELEKILTHARLPVIRQQIQPKTLIYTHYIQGIDSLLKNALEADGWRVGFYTGEDKSGLPGFLKGKIDVLIGSSAIGTGVDGLQHVCNQLIINVLPWTHAEFEQLKGRIYRQGQVSDRVKLVIPLTFATVNGEHWSWCESKMQRLRFKKSIADAAVDGVVPEGHLRTPAQAYQDVITWLERLETGERQIITRPKIIIPIPDTDPADVQRRLRRYGDFSTMNRLWNQTHSAKTHQRLQENPEEWANYHTLYQESRKDWTVIPYEEMIRWCQQRSGYVIGDFGCGEAKLAEAISDRHTVYNFDHIAINNNVIACNMAHVPLNDEELDVAIFSLSLMGSNFTDYLKEAYRTLKLDGQLHIIEATSRFNDINQFRIDLEALGFTIISVQNMWKFTHIRAMKTERQPQAGVELKF
ncbi:MAG: helicase-related protein [Phormidium sp.]